MLYFFYGDDTYRLGQKVVEIKKHFLGLHPGAAIENISPTVTPAEFEEAFKQGSIFASKKLLLADLGLLNDAVVRIISQKIDFLIKSANVFILTYHQAKTAPSVGRKVKNPRPEALIKLLMQKALTQEFKALSGANLANWVVAEFKKNGSTVSKQALAELVRTVGSNTALLAQEINKLANFSHGRIVQVADIDQVVKDAPEAEIFKALDALVTGQKNESWLILSRLLQRGQEPVSLLGLMAFQFRNLLMAKYLKEHSQRQNAYFSAQQVAEIMEVHPFVAKKAMAQAEYFTFDQLKQIYRRIFETDGKIKTSQLSGEEGLRTLVADI